MRASPERMRVLAEVADERLRQIDKWPEDYPDGTGSNALVRLRDFSQGICKAAASAGVVTFTQILQEEVAEALAEADPVRLRAELIQVAAVAIKWIEALDRRPAK